MRITYDPAIDALYIEFTATEVRTQRVTADIALDFDADGALAGIEILDASAVVADPASLDAVTLERL